MSVLIKNMAKPKSCVRMVDGELEMCPFVNTDDDCVLQLGRHCYGTWEDQYADCPLVELPEKHGRLIDADALMDIFADRLVKVSGRYGVDSAVAGAVSGAMTLLDVQPTVIEAEGEG